MTAKETALKDIKVHLDELAAADSHERFYFNDGKNENWDVWTLRVSHVKNPKNLLTPEL